MAKFVLPPGAVKALGGLDFYFLPETHQYFAHGREVRSVSSILKGAGFIDATHYTDEHRDRGHRVHAATHLIDEGRLSTFDPRDGGYLSAYMQFLDDKKPKWKFRETPIIHPIHLYGVTPDAAGLIERWDQVTEYKTTERPTKKILEAWALQTAAQMMAIFDVVKIPVVARSALTLSKTGKYGFIRFPIRENQRDRARFLSLPRAID